MHKNKTRLDELAKLLKNPPHNLLVDVYNENIKTIKEPSVNKPTKKKYTLNQIGDALFEFIKVTNDNFKQVNSRIDNLEKDVKGLKQDVKHINARLDYNNLKKLPENR